MLMGPRISVVTRDDLITFLKSKKIDRVRIGLGVYYNVTQFEKAWKKTHTLTPNRKYAGK
jgi:hypothetical protein